MSNITPTEGTRYMCFSLGGENYAIPLLSVKEVIAVPHATPIPGTPSYFLGIMNLRGQVISVLDLRSKFGIKPGAGAETSVIICDLDSVVLGVVVDSINYVFSPEAKELSGRPDIPGNKQLDSIVGVFRKENDIVLFLDIAKALNVEDFTAIKNGKKAA